MNRFESLAKRLRVVLVIADCLIAVMATIACYLLYAGLYQLTVAGAFGEWALVTAAIVLPAAIAAAAYGCIAIAGRIKAGLLMVVALRVEGGRLWRTEEALAEAAGLSPDQAGPVLASLVAYRYRGDLVVGRYRCESGCDYILTEAGALWADRVLRVLGGI